MPLALNHLQWWEVQAPAAPETGASASGGYMPWMPIITTTISLILFVWLGA